MTTGLILLLIAGVLVLLGVGQRVLDKLRLNDRQALLWIALILAGGLIPEIPITNRFRFNHFCVRNFINQPIKGPSKE